MRSRALRWPSALLVASFCAPPIASTLAVRSCNCLSKSSNGTCADSSFERDASAPRVAYHVACNHKLLDRSRAVVQAKEPHIAVKTLDCVVLHVAGSPMNLYCAIGDPSAHFRGEVL